MQHPFSKIPRRRLVRAVALAAASLAAATVGAGTARANACSVSSAYNGSDFSYVRCQIPDVDQVRQADLLNGIPGLPGNGTMYCAPAAALDVMAYIANHGYPSVAPGTGYWGPESGWPPYPQYNKMTNAIAQMGAMMQTDASGGTGGSTGLAGLGSWLQASGVGDDFIEMEIGTPPGSDGPTLKDMALAGLNGAVVMPAVGWYKYESGSGWVRKGGHVMALAVAKGSGSNQLLGVEDPAFTNDDPFEQSVFSTDTFALTPQTGWFGGSFRTMQYVSGLGSNAYLDGYFYVAPLQGLTAEKNFFVYLKPFQLLGEDGSSEPKYVTFPSADGGTIADLAVDPAGTSHPYLIAGEDTVWQLDTLTGRSTAIASVPGARRIMIGGRDRTRYVLTSDSIVSLSRDGRILHRVGLRVPLADLAYDTKRDAVIGISAQTDAIYTFDAALDPTGAFALPQRVCEGGDISIQYDPASGAVWLHCDGSPQVVRVDLSTRGAAVTTVALADARAPVGLTLTDHGRLVLTDGGRVVVYEANGQRVSSGLAGLPGGSAIDVRRSFSNIDPRIDADPNSWNGD